MGDATASRVEMFDALVRMGLTDPDTRIDMEPLTGGVSSDIWYADLPQGPVCIKRALAKLRVAADWRAPVQRNAYEAAWLREAGMICPDAVPRILGEDVHAGAFAMEYLPPAHYPVWKAQLLAGVVEPAFADQVGERLGRIHAATAAATQNQALASRFDTDETFYAIRLEPYLVATATRHPSSAPWLHTLVERTAATRVALVHGDVSPKNILCGPRGPVFIDAECAWYGDPAFDIAFCLNHLLLKCLVIDAAHELRACFDALVRTYLTYVAWEPPADLETRIATLLPGLTLARVDGKSPVEYITEHEDQEFVRRNATALLARRPSRLREVADFWWGRIAHR